ncbi:hypothetical protein R83H12_02845 [Fibrobacteria bacterium R8-3-H12]
MPGIFDLPSNTVSAYVNDILGNIIQKDVLVRNKWKKEEHFNKTTAFLFDSIGSPISPKKITNSLLSNGIRISHNTVGDYLTALTESYLFYKVNFCVTCFYANKTLIHMGNHAHNACCG